MGKNLTWKEVSPRTQPCPICHKTDWCAVTLDGQLAVCRRIDTGEGQHKIDKAGCDYWLYSLNGKTSPASVDLPSEQTAGKAPSETLHEVYSFLIGILSFSTPHLENLRKRGLTDEEIRRREYRSLPERERAELARRLVERFGADTCGKVPGLYVKDGSNGQPFWSLAGQAGILIPVRNLAGQIVALKVRADTSEDGPRYLYVSSKSHGGPGPGAPVHVPIFEGNRETIRLTEGELKADIATALTGMLTISIPGVSAWRAALPVIKEIDSKTVRLAFDADANRNENVARALRLTASLLIQEGYTVELETWPEERGKGIDDILAGGYMPEVKSGESVMNEPGKRQGEFDSESDPFLANAIPWPDPLEGQALRGLAGDIVRTIEPHTESDIAALLVQFLVAFGNCIGRKAHFVAEADKHFLNLFAVLIGVTSKGRKGSSWGHIRRIFSDVDPGFQDRLSSGLSSGEGLVYAVRNPIEKSVPVKDGKGKPTGAFETVIEDPGVEDKRLTVYEAEFAQALKVLGREGNTLSPIIRQSWDTGDLNTMTKNNRTKATGAHISIIGHITKDELLRYLTETESANGFGNRFLWLCVKRSKSLPEGGAIHTVNFAPLYARLKAALDFASQVGELQRDGEARQLWWHIYEELSEGKPGLLGAMTARSEAQVMRLGCIYALLDCSPVVKADHLQSALALWRYSEASVRFVFGESLGDPMADEIYREICSAPGGLTQTEINDLLHGHKNTKQISQALRALIESGQIVMEKKPTKGRSVALFKATKVAE